MSTRSYRLTVLGCALSWLLLGLHLPTLHAMTHHGRAPTVAVLGAVALLAIMAAASLLVLLRAPQRGAT